MDFNPNKEQDRTTGLSAIMQTEYGQFLQGIVMAIMMAFSTPLESWLRYDFGERYYTRGNYLSGITTMSLWLLIVGGISYLLSGAPLFSIGGSDIYRPEGRISGLFYALFRMLTGGEYSSYAIISGVFYLIFLGHVFFGLYHFYRIWYRSRTGQALHSYDPGKSRLRFVTRMLFGAVNGIASIIVTSLAVTMPPRLRRDESRLSPVFDDEDGFTKIYLEPAIGFTLGILFFLYGFGLLGLYFVFAGAGIGYIAKMQYLYADGKMLDLRDQFIDQTVMDKVHDYAGEHHYSDRPDQRPLSKKAENAAYQISKIVERQPDLAQKVKQDNASLFDMMEELNPNLRNVAKSQTEAAQ